VWFFVAQFHGVTVSFGLTGLLVTVNNPTAPALRWASSANVACLLSDTPHARRLALSASLIHLPIRETTLVRANAPAAT
jgi:hypothetical protein